MWYLGEITGNNSYKVSNPNYKGHYIAQMASKWLKNKPKMKNSLASFYLHRWHNFSLFRPLF